jgi:hypothetical protein
MPLWRGPGWSFFLGKLDSLQSDEDDYGGQPQRSRDLMVCVQLRWVGRVVVCALATVVRTVIEVFSLVFLAIFLLINRPNSIFNVYQWKCQDFCLISKKSGQPIKSPISQ